MDNTEAKTGLHPLHSMAIVEWWDRCEPGGYETNRSRRTGRTTSIALRKISEAIREPGQPIPLIDHHPGRKAAHHLFLMVGGIVRDLDLREMNLIDRAGAYFLCFGPEK